MNYLSSLLLLAQTAAPVEPTEPSRIDLIQTYIEHHLSDARVWHLPGLHIPLPAWMSLHVVMLMVAALFLIVLLGGTLRKPTRVPRGLSNLLEVFVVFIRDDIAVPSLGEIDGRKMTPLFCSFFFFVLTLNLMGLIPLFTTATANYSVTAALSIITFVVIVFGALFKNGPKGLASAFIPSGVPLPMLFLLTPLEVVGLFIKVFALAVRLFANMLAGHVVVFTLIGIVVAFGAIGIPAIGMAVFIMLIELLVAFLQAYIFTLLSAVFIGQVHHPAH